MKNKSNYIIIPLFIIFIIFLIGCASLYTDYDQYSPKYSGRHPEFTTNNVMKIIQGLSPEEIVKRFGLPDRTSIQTLGTATENPWQALIYEYVMGPHPQGIYEIIDNVNIFYFSTSLNILESWTIELAYTDNSKYQEIENMEIIFHYGKFTGLTKNGIPHGNGQLIYNDGTKYEGQFQNGLMHGNGQLIYDDGTKYEGQYKNGLMHGKGCYIYPDGTKYEGDFLNAEMTGKGILIYPDGTKYEGDFLNAEMSGKGILIYPDGGIYEGQFINARPSDGWYISADGTKSHCYVNEDGEWVDF